MEATKSDTKLAEMKKEYEELHQKRMEIQSNYSDLKLKIEAQQKNAENEFSKLTTNRQHAAARLHRANTKKLELEVESTRELDDLKVHLNTIKEQLRDLIILAHKEQDEIIRIDEERNKDEDDSIISKSEIENIEMLQNQNSSVDQNSILQSIDVVKRKKLNKKTKKNKKVRTRLNTANGATIVRPQIKNDNNEPI